MYKNARMASTQYLQWFDTKDSDELIIRQGVHCVFDHRGLLTVLPNG